MSHYKGAVGCSLMIERKPKKKKKLPANERRFSSEYQCPNCKNNTEKFVKLIDDKPYCLKCFINYNTKVIMYKR